MNELHSVVGNEVEDNGGEGTVLGYWTKTIGCQGPTFNKRLFISPHVTMQHPRVLCRVQSALFLRDIQSHIPGALHIGRDRAALFQWHTETPGWSKAQEVRRSRMLRRPTLWCGMLHAVRIKWWLGKVGKNRGPTHSLSEAAICNPLSIY